MTQNKLRKDIQQLRRGIMLQFLYFNGHTLEYRSDEIQEIFDESMDEMLKDNKGTPGQYKRLLKTYFTLKSIRNHTKNGNDISIDNNPFEIQES